MDGPGLGVQALRPEVEFDRHRERLLIMRQIVRIGLDIAKRWFQVRAVDEAEREVFNRKLARDKVLGFLGSLPPCEVALEACSSSHSWGREIGRLGHRVRLISPNYVKPFVKRGKSDAHDAGAICEAASRPDMRFVPVKTEEQQAALMQHTSRQLLIDQRTAVANSLRSQFAEFGVEGSREFCGGASRRALLVVCGGPSRQRRSGVIEVVEDRLIEQFVAHAAVERFADPVLHRFSRRNEMPSDPAALSPGEHSVGGELGPWSETIRSGLPRQAMMAASSRATLRPEIQVSAVAARHSLVTSSITLRMRKRRPFESWSWTKSTDQRAFGLASTRIGARMPVARLRPLRLRTVRPSSR